MEKFKDIMKKILFPHRAAIGFIIPVATVMLVYVFVVDEAPPVLSYGAYVFSFYALILFCMNVCPFIYGIVRRVREENKYVVSYHKNPVLRIKISLYSSVVLNLLYALLQLWLGFIQHSVWFYSLAAYYVLLLIMRVYLLSYTGKNMPGENKKREWKKYRFCGFALLLMNTTMSVIVAYIVRQNRGFSYNKIHTITMAAYSFTTFTMAIVNAVRYRKYESPVMSAAKAVSLVAAVFSMLTLETAMLSAFRESDSNIFRQNMTGISGEVVCIFILVMAIYMIIHANRKLKE